MAYNPLKTMDLYNLVARWHAGYTISQISRALNLDRKTVRGYLKQAKKVELSRNEPLPEKAELLKFFQTFLPTNQRCSPVRNLLIPHQDEIMSLITDKTHPLKPKTAYEVICERHELKVSYGTFKRFLHTHAAEIMPRHSTCRFETEPGEEVQIDYCKLGLLYDPLCQKKRTVYAFIARLSFSRLKFVDLVYRQDQRSFIALHLRMFDFFGGVPKRLVIDNLKSGVITPDLYDPQLNKAYQELAEHYGCFVDPAHVRKPKDKGKVERSAPLSNQTFRDAFSVGANGSIGLDVRVSPKLVVGPELGYSAFGLDRKGFLKLNEVEDTNDIKIKGGELSVAEILGVAKFHLNTVEAITGFYLIAGAGLSASRIAKSELETPEGDFEVDEENNSDFMAIGGVGLQHKFGEKWNTYVELRYTKIFTDESYSYLPVRVGVKF